MNTLDLNETARIIVENFVCSNPNEDIDFESTISEEINNAPDYDDLSAAERKELLQLCINLCDK